jgi:hypothetical protein
MSKPISIALKTAQPAVRFAAIVAVGVGLLFLRAQSDQFVAISIDSIEFFRIIETADKNELQEWRAR